jgi:hypothetical protein
MGEDDIRKYLGRQTQAPAKPAAVRVVPRRARRAPAPEKKTFEEFNATQIFCPRCRRAMPVRSRILLFLPDGDLYDYNCTGCGMSLGTRKAGR